MSKKGLKNRVIEAIDDRAKEIMAIGDAIWKTPELGYKEFRTAEYVKAKVQEMGWKSKSPIALTGLKAYLKTPESPAIGIRTGGCAIYPDRIEIIERIGRNTLQVRTEIYTCISIGIGFCCHSANKLIRSFTGERRQLLVVLEFVEFNLGTNAAKIG